MLFYYWRNVSLDNLFAYGVFSLHIVYGLSFSRSSEYPKTTNIQSQLKLTKTFNIQKKKVLPNHSPIQKSLVCQISKLFIQPLNLQTFNYLVSNFLLHIHMLKFKYSFIQSSLAFNLHMLKHLNFQTFIHLNHQFAFTCPTFNSILDYSPKYTSFTRTFSTFYTKSNQNRFQST